jgi:hypothetical protein
VERWRFELKHLGNKDNEAASRHQNRDLESRRGAGGAIFRGANGRRDGFLPSGEKSCSVTAKVLRSLGVRQQDQSFPGPLLHSAKFRTEFGNDLLVVQHIIYEHEGKRGLS